MKNKLQFFCVGPNKNSAMSAKIPKDPSATVLDFVPLGLEDAFLLTKDVSCSSIFLNEPSTYSNMSQQTIAGTFRGAATFDGHVSFEIPPLGDRITWLALEIDINSWFSDNIVYFLDRGATGGYTYIDSSAAWTWANALGAIMIERVWIEAGGIELDGFGGEWIDIWSKLFLAADVGAALRRDCLGSLSIAEAATFRPADTFPVEGGQLLVPIPTWCLRHGRNASLPLSAMKEGTVVVHVKFRPFSECVRSNSGSKSCGDSPIGKTFEFTDNIYMTTRTVVVPPVVPLFRSCRLLTNYAFIDGPERQTIMHNPFADLVQRVETFRFDAPLRHQVSASADSVLVSLPLEAAHTVDELIWVLRRTGVQNNNDWTNYGSATGTPLLRTATIQVATSTWICEDERYFRSSHAGVHSGQQAASDAFIYHYAFAEQPEAYQPGSSVNAGEAAIRLVLDVRQPPGDGWEVIVFVLYRNWLRYQNGLVAPIFE
jgi:hypothetical protein